MFQQITALAAALSVMMTQSSAVIKYADSLPPQPDQSTLSCHDTAWEEANLTPVAGGINHKKLSPFVQSAINDAARQGLYLTIASSYRSCDLQTQLRTQACGSGNYNLYQKPSNQCTPPTEPAGHSLHQEGLAVDFACSGYPMFETSPCLSWLRSNAARYHLKSHAIEAWHWSTTGK